MRIENIFVFVVADTSSDDSWAKWFGRRLLHRLRLHLIDRPVIIKFSPLRHLILR